MKAITRNLFAIFVACTILFYVSSPECSAATIRAASASYADVSAAVAIASSGTTVEVPAGSATWNSTLKITTGIKLQGAGIDQTIITGRIRLISWEPSATAVANHGNLSIEGFTFDGNNSTSADLEYKGLINGANGTTYVRLVILNNKFQNTTGSGIWIRGIIYGVAALNQFDMVAMPIRAFGTSSAIADGLPDWSMRPQAYGTANNYYFEDNTISFSSSMSDPAGWLEAGQGGRIVVRYNTWDEANATPGEFWDVHGLQGAAGPGATNCEANSTMVAEYYGNKLFNMTTPYRWMYHRGGWLLMFNNTLNSTTSPGNSVTQYFCDSCQKGGSYVQKVNNTYFWANLVNGSNKAATIGDPGAGYGCVSDPLVENTNFFNYSASCTASACSSGTGCGASTPAGTCTTGVGYWKTSQSCSNMSGMVGANPATPISGTLFKCTSPNTWTAYYTPYMYPHPLRSGVSPIGLTAPPNFRVQNPL